MRICLLLLLSLTTFAAEPAVRKKPAHTAPPSPPAPLATQIADLLATPAAKDAFWGIEIRDLNADKILYSNNADHFFVPASNAKLFTTALALSRLGPGYRFHTRVILSGRDLVLVGAGDPNLSGRTLPYQPRLPEPAPLAAINQFADEIVAKGIRHVEGNIVGDDTAFVYDPYPPGWGLTDTFDDDGPPISAICVDDNVANLQIEAALADGALTLTSWQLPFELFHVDNALLTDGQAHRELHYQRLPGSRELRIWGNVPPGRVVEPLPIAIDDPARFAAEALKDALTRRGVKCDGSAIARHQFPGYPPLDPLTGDILADRTSLPLMDAAQIVDKLSQNLHAEILLRDVALRLTGKGTREGGLAALTVFLNGAGIDPHDYQLSDGSGLSRYDLVTPHAITTLLQYMANSPLRNQFIALLPIGGVDGSLRHRFNALQLHSEIHAKTGSLTHVTALSGYAKRADGSMLAFSILVNNYESTSAAVREIIDKIAVAMLV